MIAFLHVSYISLNTLKCYFLNTTAEIHHACHKTIKKVFCLPWDTISIRYWSIVAAYCTCRCAFTHIRLETCPVFVSRMLLVLYMFASNVQIIFSFWSFEISEDILRNQTFIIGLDSFSNQYLIYLSHFDNTSLCIDYSVESCKIIVFFLGSMLPNLKAHLLFH